MVRFAILYASMVLAIVLAIWRRDSPGLRLLSVLILCFVSLFHITFLMSAHRIVELGGAAQAEPGSEYDLALRRLQFVSQSEIIPFLSLILAFSLLSLLPTVRRDK